MMKRLIVLLITAIMMNGVIAQTTAINESFESWPAPDWNIYEIGAGGHWVHSTLYGSNLGYGGGNCAKIQISNDIADNWLVSPQVSVVTNDYQLTFYELNDDLQYYAYEGVYISTGSGNPDNGDFMPLSESLQVEGTWVEHTVDLSAFQGDDIYLAFVYTGTWTHWNVDEVVVSPSTLIDGALTEILNPVGINPVPSTEDVIVTLHNYGTDIIDNADIEWSINNVVQGTYQATSLSLDPGDDINITVGQYNFATQGDYLISLTLMLTDDSNPSNDLVEDTYFVTDPKDAELTKISPEGYLPVEGLKDVVVTVLNNGDFDIDEITVEWDVNGEVQTDYQTTSLVLEPGAEIDLPIGQFNFANGLNEINTTVIVSGDEDLSNNSDISYLSVNILWESFEGEVFPPEMWTADDYPLHDYFWPPPHGEFYYVSQTDDNMFGYINDTLFTPLLNIENGDEITFWVNNSAFFTNDDQLIWKDGITGDVHLIESIESDLEQWDVVTIDISAAAGINYIGFVNNNNGSFGTNSLDMISSDASIHQFNDDLGIKDFQFEYLAGLDEVHTFSVDLRNYGLNEVQGSSYSVKLMTEAGELVAQQSGVTLQTWEESTIEITHTFTGIEVLKVYAYIEFAADQAELNNSSVIHSVYSVPADYQINDIGFAENVNLNIPFNTTGNDMSLGQDDISQHLYFQDELGIEGYLYGVTLYYHELYAVGQYVPLQVSVKQTDLEDLTGGWVDAEELDLVFNDTIEVYPGHNSVYIPFDEPILITGTNNLVIQYYQYEPEWPYTACRFYATNNPGGPIRTIRLLDVYNLDPNDPPDYWGEHTENTFTSFVFQPIDGEGIVSGVVYDENDEPIEGALLTVAGTGIEELTFGGGEYNLPTLPFETYDITASYLGYNDETHTVILNEPTETEDFYLTPLPEVSVFGVVYGSNAPDIPLEGVKVTIEGYDSLTTYTNADGEFMFETVYGNHDYTFTCKLYGYHDYMELISLEDLELNMGIIILDEDLISAYNVITTPDEAQALIEWLNPISSQKTKIQYDTDIPYYSYTNEPDENVWLGNLFENEDVLTVTSVEIRWDIYELAHDFVTIDIVDLEGNRLVSSQPFLTHNDSLMTIEIPNISIKGNFYAMVHWKNNPESTDALLTDNSEGIANNAYLMYPNELPVLFTEYIGGPDGSFFVRVNTLDEVPKGQNREVVSYNIYKGLSSEINLADTWTPLNLDPLTDLMFIDDTWSNNDPQTYTYAIEAVYMEGNSDFTFSNFVSGFTSLIENEIDNVNIYPNPASSILNLIGVEGTTITVYNIIGEIIYSEDIQTPISQIDVSNLENGNYFIRIVGSQNQIIKKLVVAR